MLLNEEKRKESENYGSNYLCNDTYNKEMFKECLYFSLVRKNLKVKRLIEIIIDENFV